MDPLAGLSDIDRLAPAPVWPETAALVLLGLGAVVLVVAARRRRAQRAASADPAGQRRQEAQRRLEAVHRDWRVGRLPDREAAYRLGALLRIGLALDRLRPTEVPAGVGDAAAWEAMVTRLAQARYGRTGGTLDEALFDAASRWLDHAEPHA